MILTEIMHKLPISTVNFNYVLYSTPAIPPAIFNIL